MSKFFLLVLLNIATTTAYAFPEMIRMGYVNCTACHVSPTGGGLLTDYGRSISNEVLSTWSNPKEELPGHGFTPPPPAWLKIGGDLRWIQTYMDNPQATATSFFPMQTDLELGFNTGKFWYVQSMGVQGGPDNAPQKDEFISHHYYALYNWTDEIYTRAGKYLMAYGLNLPDHTSFVRTNLGFDQNEETYNVDVGSVGEKWNAIVNFSFGRDDDKNADLEKGVTAQVAATIGDTHKVTGSFAYLKNSSWHRYLMGPSIQWGFDPTWIFLGEYDYQEKTVDGTPTQKGAVTYSRLQHEWVKGFHSYLLHQWSYLDFTQLNTRVNSFGLGFLFYPRPHFEFGAELDQSTTATVVGSNTLMWLLLHYYF